MLRSTHLLSFASFLFYEEFILDFSASGMYWTAVVPLWRVFKGGARQLQLKLQRSRGLAAPLTRLQLL